MTAAGTGTFRQRGFCGNNPNDTTTISFATYELGIGGNPIENILVVPAGGNTELVVVPSAAVAGGLDFSWASQGGKVYDRVSCTDLPTAPETWDVLEEAGDPAATPPLNTPLRSGPRAAS